MTGRLPVVATLLVLSAVAVMIGLGFWQLGRMEQKRALLERYRTAVTMNSAAPFPADALGADAVLYRHATIECRRVTAVSAMAGRSARGESGFAHTAQCTAADGSTAKVVLGWSRQPDVASWTGGTVQGIIAPGPRLVADPPLAGLQANARPDPSELPDNHFAYAVQWFLFAATALVVYALALRKRLAGTRPHG